MPKYTLDLQITVSPEPELGASGVVYPEAGFEPLRLSIEADGESTSSKQANALACQLCQHLEAAAREWARGKSMR